MRQVKRGCMALLLTLVMAVGCISAVYADAPGGSAASGDDLTLIQRPNQTGTLVDADSSTYFNLKVYREDDEFTVYQVAELIWNSTLLAQKGSFENAAWVKPVADWLANDAKYEAHANFSQYTTPAVLGKEGQKDSSAAVSLMREMQKALKSDEAFKNDMDAYKAATKTGASYNTGIAGNTWELNTVNADGIKETVSFTGDISPAVEADVFQSEYKIEGLPFGLFMVDPKNTTSQRTYQPVLVDVTPKQTGPSGNWYYGDVVNASLKFQNISIEKFINSDTGKTDIVRAGERVSFKIKVQVPQYPVGTTNKIMYANDDMAAGFTLDVASAYLEYSTDDGVNWAHVDPANYTLVIAPSANIFYAKDDQGNEKEFAFSIPNASTESTGTYTTFYLNNGKATVLGNYALDAAAVTQVMNAYNTKVVATEKVTGPAALRPYTKSIINADFNYDKLQASVATDAADPALSIKEGPVTNLRLGYDAIVNDNMFIGSDDNTNIISFYYVEDSTGTIDVQKDTVRAWTYAAQIIKIDGDTVDKDGNPIEGVDTQYLKNAKFQLYRYSDVYCPGTSEATPSEYEKFIWLQGHDGQTHTGQILADVTGNIFYNAIDVDADTCPENAAAHKHIQVYELFKDNIVSNDTADGVIVKGLDPDEYILIETDAPTSEGNYNKLSEGLWFEIVEYTESYAQENHDNSFKGFIGDDGEDRIDGVYPIKVLNFQGTQLPSTGGVGTLIFTILGIAVMFIAMIAILIVSRKKREEAQEG